MKFSTSATLNNHLHNVMRQYRVKRGRGARMLQHVGPQYCRAANVGVKLAKSGLLHQPSSDRNIFKLTYTKVVKLLRLILSLNVTELRY